MRPFRRETGTMVPLPRADVDTDQIIPKQFLKRIERSGYGEFLFHDWRRRPDGSRDPDFVLERPEYRGGIFLLAGRNFGCGSSREHAVWALTDHGFRAVIAPSFADIFQSNATKVGLLPVVLPDAEVERLLALAAEHPDTQATVDLGDLTVEVADRRLRFELDGFQRSCLLGGLDDIGLTMEHEREIAAFEAARPAWMPDLRRDQRLPARAS